MPSSGNQRERLEGLLLLEEEAKNFSGEIRFAPSSETKALARSKDRRSADMKTRRATRGAIIFLLLRAKACPMNISVVELGLYCGKNGVTVERVQMAVIPFP